jgi:hypothetical protein
MREYLEALWDWAGAGRRWKPLPRWAIVAWLLFYAWFLVYVFGKHGGFLFIDTANMVVHEGGHALFSWFGATLGLWGGTLLQWLVPFLLAAYFFHERQPAAFVFCLFFFFENWIYTSTYMADARAMELPLVTLGDPDFAKHDWNTIFGNLGILDYDTRIAAVVNFLGWCGMLGCVAWLANRWRHNTSNAEMSDPEFDARFLKALSKDSIRTTTRVEKEEPPLKSDA